MIHDEKKRTRREFYISLTRRQRFFCFFVSGLVLFAVAPTHIAAYEQFRKNTYRENAKGKKNRVENK